MSEKPNLSPKEKIEMGMSRTLNDVELMKKGATLGVLLLNLSQNALLTPPTLVN